MNAWLTALSEWLMTLGLHQTISNVEWIVPAVQTVHILAIAIVFSASLILSLRAANVSGVDWSPARWGARLNHWTATALVILLVSGAILIIGEPERSLLSPVFQLKMVLVVIAGLLSWWLASRLKHLHGEGSVGFVERLVAVLVVLLWVAVISAGRWIAYYVS
jgi:hypothetical protein